MGPMEALKLIIIAGSLNQPVDVDIPTNVDCDKIRTESETVCTACNIYHEARGESFEGRIAVANVTRNRVDSDRFPDDFCEVVWERKQFSWTKDGRSDKIYDSQSWEEAYLIAYITVNDYRNGIIHLEDKTSGSLWYHADYVNPKWAKDQKPAIEIGDHKFYTQVAFATIK